MSRNNPVKGAKPYLYNPRNKRVMVTTQAKLDRRDEYDKPYFIQCDSPYGPDGKNVKVNKGSVAPPVIENYQKGQEVTVEVSTTTDLRAIVMASEDKDELVQIGSDIGINLPKTMKVSTMQKRISAQLDEI